MEIKSNLWVAGAREGLKEATSCGMVKMSEPLPVPDHLDADQDYLGFLKTQKKLQPKEAIDEH